MADYILARKSRNIASNAVHVLLNILLGLGAVMVTVFSGSPALGIILVLMSKWRVFAVRGRYIWLNLKANLVDLIVGISVVLLSYYCGTYYAGTSLSAVHFILAGLYTVWLLFIKPMSSENATMIQSLVAVFLGISATTFMAASIGSPLVAIISAFLVGYAASRHVLAQTNSKDFTLTTLVGGLVFAEVAWLCNSWTIIYYFDTLDVKIPQIAIILTIFAFIYNYARQVMIKYQEDFRFRHIIGPVIFGAVLIGVIVLAFSVPSFNITTK